MSHISPYPVKKGESVELTVESLAFGGRGVSKVEGYTVFVHRALPGQTVRARIVKRRKGYAEARIEEVLTSSPDQVEPRCSHFGLCGGCLHQHYAYPAQLRAKQDQVRECFRRLAGLDLEVEPTLPCAEPYEYRNKMEYSFSPTRWLEEHELDGAESMDRTGLGLHIRGRHDRVLEIDRCHLQKELGSQVLAVVRELSRASGLGPYSTHTHQGFWRFVMIRTTTFTDESMVVLITNTTRPGDPGSRAVEEIARALAARFPELTSIVHGQTGRKASVAFSETTRVLHGEPVIRERLLGETYEIGPNTFFQTNSSQAEQLFTEALNRGDFHADDTVWDLYCGAGAISLPLARRVKRVIGMELVEEAVAAARRTAQYNGIDNAEFVAGDLKDLVGSGGQDFPVPDAVVLDPPRDGLHPSVLEALIQAGPSRIVYVSCNPATLARDVAGLHQAGWSVGPVLPVDMFPHTAHVECVVSLRKS